MSKITLTDLVNLTNQTTAVNAINSNNAVLETASNNTLSRDGTQPNTMGAALDMNSNQIINLPVPSTQNSPARLIDVVTNPTITIPGTGTSGHLVPFLDGNNTWSGTNTHSSTETFNGAVNVNGTITLPANNVTNAQLATVPANTVKGSIVGGTPTDLTTTQLTTLVNPVTATTTGAVPILPNNTSTFLRGDGIFAAPAYTLLNTLTAANVATLSDITSITSAYSIYELIFENVIPVTGTTNLNIQVHSGGIFQTGATYSSSVTFTTGGSASQLTSNVGYLINGNIGSTTIGLSGTVRIYNPTGSQLGKMYTSLTSQPNAGNTLNYVTTGGGYWNSAAAVDGFQVLFSAGNIASGVIKVYGII